MKETKDLRELLDTAFEETPDDFHRRVQDTLVKMKCMEHRKEHVVKKKMSWGVAVLAALLIMSAMGVAAKLSDVLSYITNTAAQNWVLDEAQNMLHEDVAETKVNDCMVALSEWICDGETLYVCVNVVDPALESESHYVEQYGPGKIRLSSGDVVGGMTWHYMRGDEESNEIIFVMEQKIANVPDAFTVEIPITCSAAEGGVRFNVTREDFGAIRYFEPSELVQLQGYTAQIVNFRATALRTYATLNLTFDESVPTITRNEIVSDYMDGLGVPEGRLDAVAGEGEEIVMPRTGKWSEDGLVYTIEMNGNPREQYPDTMVYCPRWGMHDYDWEGDMPPLSMDGAVVMRLKEVR